VVQRIPAALERLAAGLVPGGKVLSAEPLAPDTGNGATEKATGYGAPLRLRVRGEDGGERAFVFRTMTANEFGHDRRADRWAEALLAFDDFGRIPGHVRALDVGAILPGEQLLSLRDASEAYLLTTWADGTLYAEDLRRVAARGESGPLDRTRCEALARYLARLHAGRVAHPAAWRRALRDLVGGGEGIAGLCDAYPDGTPGAPRVRLETLERSCLAWRHRLRDRADRLARIHGDFHPFNIVFGDGPAFSLVDASRGCLGDPADDVAALAVNYLFFAAGRRPAWRHGLGPLWFRFFEAYAEAGGDMGLLETIAPHLAWRALVVCCPRFYPKLGEGLREALLGLAERALAAPRFDPAWGAEVLG